MKNQLEKPFGQKKSLKQKNTVLGSSFSLFAWVFLWVSHPAAWLNFVPRHAALSTTPALRRAASRAAPGWSIIDGELGVQSLQRG